MVGRFLLRRSSAARARAHHAVEISDERVVRLVTLATTLAVRMDAMPSAGAERDLARRARVQVLHRTAEAGRRTLAARVDIRADGRQRRHYA